MGLVPPNFASWMTRSYWHFQGFWCAFAAVLVFGMLLTTWNVKRAALGAVIALAAGLLWSAWARRWGRFRDRDPWE
jgi:hypothetical protein